MSEESCNLRFTISVVTVWDEARLHAHTCAHAHIHRAHTHRCPLALSFCTTTLVDQPQQRGRWHTYKDRHSHTYTHLCTWLNVTVRHILICWRYRVNDGHVVTFTQARDFTQTLSVAKGDGNAWYVYGKTLSCPFIMEMWRSRLASSGISPHFVCQRLCQALPCATVHLYVCVCVYVCLCGSRHAREWETGTTARVSVLCVCVCVCSVTPLAELLFSCCQFRFASFYMFSWNPPQMEISYRHDRPGNSFSRHFIIHL